MMHNFIEALLQISLSTAAVIGVMLLLVPLWQKRYSARWRKGIWLLIALRLLIPVSLELPQTAVQLEMDLQAAPAWQGKQMPEDNNAAAPASTPTAEAETLQAIDDGAREVQAAASPSATVLPMQQPISRGMLLFAVWLAGAAAFLLWHIVHYAFFRHKALAVAQSLEDREELLQQAADALPLKTVPRVVVSAAVQGPMLLGFVKPVVLLPQRFYGHQELTLILRHELTHYKLHDLWYKLILLVANAAHWFNPLVWLLVRQANRDVEQVCDEQVVRNQDMAYRKAYSMIILNTMANQKGVALSTYLSKQAQSSKKRFIDILYPKQTKKGMVALLVVVLLAVVASGCLQVGREESVDAGLALYEKIAPWLPEGAIAQPRNYAVEEGLTGSSFEGVGRVYHWQEEWVEGNGNAMVYVDAAGDAGKTYHYKRDLYIMASSAGEIIEYNYSCDEDVLPSLETFWSGCDLDYAEKEVQALVADGKQLQLFQQSGDNGYQTYVSKNTLQDYRYKLGFIAQGGYQQYLQKYYDNPDQLSQAKDWLSEQFHQQMENTFYLENGAFSGAIRQSKQDNKYVVELDNFVISWRPQLTKQQWAQLDTLMETDSEGHQFVWKYLQLNCYSLHSFKFEAPVLEDGTLDLEQAVVYPLYSINNPSETPLNWQQEAERWQMLWAAAHFAQGYTEKQPAMMDFFGQAKQLHFADYSYNTTISYLLSECDKKSIDFTGESGYGLQIELPNETQSNDYFTMILEQIDGQWQVTNAWLEK